MEIKATLSEVSQTFDLEEITGADLSGFPELGLTIGQAIIDYIIERVDSGRGLGGQQLRPPYSDAYEDSLAFKAFNKSKNDVNMRLTGQMLADLDILEFDGNRIKIGFSDETETAKAYNHQTGDTVPRRPFFGLTESELNNIIDEFSADIQAASERDEDKGLIQTLKDLFSEPSLPSFREPEVVMTLRDLLDD